MSLVSFGSDNHSGIHPRLLQALVNANQSPFAPSYEQDEASQGLRSYVLKTFQAEDCALVFNGTAANVICLQLGLKSYQSVLCAESSHLNLDECGAPEKIAGVKLVPLPMEDGKISFEAIKDKLIRRGDQHHSQVAMISITQPTEHGTVYSVEELKNLRALCDQEHLLLHIDGARLANAAVHLDCELQDITQYADLISLGGAKNGLLAGELVIVRNPRLAEGLKFYRKQSLQLPSKTRFFAAPFLEYISTGLWQEIARHENQLAERLAEGVAEFLKITHSVQANSVFCLLPKELLKELRQQFFFYVWDERTFEVRLMTSFATTEQHVDDFIQTLKAIKQKRL